MRPRHPRTLPKLWLFTDERMGDALWDALARLPRGAGVVFRHHATPRAERRALALRVRRIVRARRLTLLIAGDAAGLRADGRHRARGRGLATRPVHSVAEAVAARRGRADLVFVSPVFPTRSHPAARVLGPARLGLLLRHVPMPAIALGGMDARAMRRLRGLPLHGWAAIDAWMQDAKKGRDTRSRP